MTKIKGNLYEYFSVFMTICRSVLLRMSNVLDKTCRGNQNMHFMFHKMFSENRAVCEIMWKI